MNVKKVFYIAAFGFLGFLLATVLHGGLELVALELIFGEQSNANSTWRTDWPLIHSIGGTLLWTIGIFFGLYAGSKWWNDYGSKPGAFGWRKES